MGDGTTSTTSNGTSATTVLGVADGGGKPMASAANEGAAQQNTPTTADGSTPGGGAPPPGDIELKLPDGFEADEAALKDFKAAAKEVGLDSAKAQKLFDVYAKAQAAADARAAAELEKLHRGWAEALKADKEFGGAEYDANMKLAQKAMVKFGTPALRRWLDETGVGNHPELVRAFVRIGKAISEDTVAGAVNGPVKTPANDEAAFLRALYDHPASASILPKE